MADRYGLNQARRTVTNIDDFLRAQERRAIEETRRIIELGQRGVTGRTSAPTPSGYRPQEAADIRGEMQSLLMQSGGVVSSSVGRTVTVGNSKRPRWKPPWTVTTAWNGEQWFGLVRPGFVNGHLPVWRTTVDAQAASGRNFETNQFTGEPFQVSAGGLIDVPLYLGPAISLPWRAIGFDGEGAVPKFFKVRGAADSPFINVALGTDAAFTAQEIGKAPPPNLRLLRACDLWIHQPRGALSSEVTLGDGLATGQRILRETLRLRPPADTDRLRILSGTYDPRVPATTIGPGAFDENAYDELVFAVVYALSPENIELGSSPDNTWQTFVAHRTRVRWNLNYRAPAFAAPAVKPPDVTLVVPLAGFAFQYLINFLTAETNEALALADNLIQANSLAGFFYTSTGGGSDSTFPPEPDPEPMGETGSDKSGRLRNAAIADTFAPFRETLDPPFPWGAMPFDFAAIKSS